MPGAASYRVELLRDADGAPEVITEVEVPAEVTRFSLQGMPPGRYRIQTAGRSFAIETANEAFRRRYHEHFETRRAALRSLARSPGIRLLDCATDAEPRTLLAQQFRPR